MTIDYSPQPTGQRFNGQLSLDNFFATRSSNATSDLGLSSLDAGRLQSLFPAEFFSKKNEMEIEIAVKASRSSQRLDTQEINRPAS
jgi:hypothetical protein